MKIEIFNLRSLVILAAASGVWSGSVILGRAAPVAFEAKSGIVGSDFTNGTDGATQYISISSDTVNAEFPGNNNRVATFPVIFPAAGTYNFYARVRVGPAGANDDSFFYANGFGSKSPTTAADWIRVNNLLSGGFANQSDVVTGSGTAGIGIWKWLNLSQFANSASEAAITFNVTAGNLTQTFQIGARENGFDMDKFVFATTDVTLTVAQLDAGGVGPPPTPRDLVSGNLIQFNDNGNWSWYMDERAVVDRAGGKLIVGSNASDLGVGGTPREGDVEAVIFDLQTGLSQRFTLKDGSTLPGVFYSDDHNAPGLLVRPDGKYLAVYAGHNTETNSYWRVYDGAAWGTEQVFNWLTIPGGTDFRATYSNPHYLSAEDRLYNFVRENDHGSPNILVSTNLGDTFSFGGQLTRSATNFNVGYVSGYFRYCDNGVDRIDFICTEAHPRDYNTSMYHGYVKNGQSFRSDGTMVDANVSDQTAPFSSDFTPIFLANTVSPPGQTNTRCWNDDVQSYADGTVAAIISTRVNDNTNSPSSNPNHAFFYCRYDGTNWTSTYLVNAGLKLYSSEEDYVGLGALNPNDPNTIYISTPYDPRDNTTFLGVHEIFKGVTTNRGATFSWTPITQKSVRDNLRPIVPAWDKDNTTLMWFRGFYSSAQSIDAAVVGIVERHSETDGKMTYVDATTNNTTLSTGAALVTGTALNQWHERTGSGNGGSVLASADVSGENAPTLKTTVTLPGAGTYDVWVNFWGSPGVDWRIMAGLSTNGMQIFRQMACQEVDPGDHDTTLVLTNGSNAFLYQAYLGRVAASSSETLDVFVDDYAIQTGTAGTSIGDTARTWYDGISCAKVNSFQVTDVARNPGAHSVTINWNSIPPQSSLTTPTYTVEKKNSLSDPTWIVLATGLSSGGSTSTYIDTSANGSAAFYRVTWP
jgi:hypothetical protein